MKNTLVHLRQLKTAALDRMTELNNRTRAERRNLTEVESIEYSMQRDWAQELNSATALGELELEVLESAPAPVAPEPDPASRPNLAARVMAWKIR